MFGHDLTTVESKWTHKAFLFYLFSGDVSKEVERAGLIP